MNSKKIFGYIFIIFAILLTFAIIGQLPTLFGVIFGFFKIFTGKLNGFQIGEVIGQIIYWIFHFVVTIALWKYGIRWTKNKSRYKLW